jgi:molecular chaperone HscC
MPLVARLVTRMFGRLPMRHVNPDQAIAIGAATAAAMKARDARFEEVILTDVCPYTLGTQISRRDEHGQAIAGFFHPVIHRNSTVPISREDTFWPLTDGQTHVLIDVYQGESPMVANNIRLGQLDVPLPPKRAAAQNGVNVRFTYDINGVLQVEAQTLADGTMHELVIEQNPGLLSTEQIAARFAALADLKIHPRSEQENVALVARAERLYEEHLFAREQVQDWIVRFRNALETQDPRIVAEHREAFRRALDELESGR